MSNNQHCIMMSLSVFGEAYLFFPYHQPPIRKNLNNDISSFLCSGLNDPSTYRNTKANFFGTTKNFRKQQLDDQKQITKILKQKIYIRIFLS